MSSRYAIGFRASADGPAPPVASPDPVPSASPAKRRKSRGTSQPPIGFREPEATSSGPMMLLELESLKELLRRDHANRTRKQTAPSQKHEWCACGFHGLVDYDGVDRACAALSKLTQAKSPTPTVAPSPQPQSQDGDRRFLVKDYGDDDLVVHRETFVCGKWLLYERLHVPRDQVRQLIADLQKAAGTDTAQRSVVRECVEMLLEDES